VTARLFVISGPSGVGKGTLIALARESLPELAVATSATTRPKRPGETDGREYHFLDEDEFMRRVGRGEFLEHVTFAGYRYGTLRSEVERRLARDESVVLEIDVPGAREIKRQVPGSVLVFVAPPDLSHLEQRLAARGANSPQEIDDRLAIAREEMAAVDEFQHVITNDDRTRAAAELTDLIRSQLAPQETA
jgi:guanylate kinase